MRVRLAALCLLLVLQATGAGAHPLLVAVVPDLPGSAAQDEGFAVGSNQEADLSGWSVSDGQGSFVFPAGSRLAPGEPVWVTGNPQDWKEHDGPPALDASGAGMRLANDGDTLTLRTAAGDEVDSVQWGGGTRLDVASPGLILERDASGGVWTDTDSETDWVTPRMHRIGESRLDEPTFPVAHLTLYASPDSSHAVLSALARSATSRLHLHVYELRSASLVDALVDAKRAAPGLALDVLVEQAPVGMTSPERHATAAALTRIQDVGGRAFLAGKGRYDDHHLKVLVADDAVAIQSENWVESGVPADPTWGNRGWGVVVHDKAAADWFDAWMQSDHEAWDTSAFDVASFDPLYEAPPRLPPRAGEYGPVVAPLELHGAFTVTPLVSPDHTADPRSGKLVELLAGATRAIETEQLDLASGASNALGWSSRDTLTNGLEEAARRGVPVRVLAASPFGNDAGNEPTLQELRAAGAQARVLERDGIATLHNKGILVDDVAVVGSMNGNQHSRSANREVDVILQGPGVAAYYRSLFDADWGGATAPPDNSVVGRDVQGLPAAPWPILLAGLAIALAIRGRR